MQEMGSSIVYKAPVEEILTEGSGGDARAVGVRVRGGREVHARTVVSNATRWDTFGRLLPEVPANEAKFRELYVKAPSFISLHLGVDAACIPVRAAPLSAAAPLSVAPLPVVAMPSGCAPNRHRKLKRNLQRQGPLCSRAPKALCSSAHP